MINKKLKFQSKFQKGQRGVIAVLTVILLLAIMLIILSALQFLTAVQQKIYGNTAKSIQAYYIAESGIEDALWRIKVNPSYGSRSYDLKVVGENNKASIVIGPTTGSLKVITSEGNLSDVIRKVEVVYAIKVGTSFYYGVQAGDMSIEIKNNAQVRGFGGAPGNVFSNIGAMGGGGGSKGIITGTVRVAVLASGISDLDIGLDAYASICSNSIIGGTLHYLEGNNYGCTAAGGSISHTAQEWINNGWDRKEPFPISVEQINAWKAAAQAGGSLNGPVIYDDGINNLDFKKIIGDLTVQGNDTTLNIKGIIYVTGSINFSNNTIIRLDPSYGQDSGMIIADGSITVGNSVQLKGSGQSSSYILLISAGSSTISLGNSVIAEEAVLYTPENGGLIIINNNTKVGQVTGWGIRLEQNAIIEYKLGLTNQYFITGPGGSWGVQSWKEY